MDNYYLSAQLPFLIFAKKPLISSNDLLAEAAKWLSRGEFKLLSSISLDDFYFNNSDNRILKEYKAFEHSLRLDIFSWRKARKEKTDFKLEVLSPSLLKDADPLEIEQRLLKLRWQFLEEAQVGEHFTFSYIVIYMLKLKVLEKLFSFEEEKGKIIFNQFSQFN